MPIIDPSKCPVKSGSIYPAPYDQYVAGRSSLRLGDAGGLTQFGANLVILQPGAKSSLRHWHHNEDEFVMITEGACTLVQDAGGTVMQVGDCAAFKAGDRNGHQFVNHTDGEARFLVVGTRASKERAEYSDVDLVVILSPGEKAAARFTYRDGTEYRGLR